MKVVHKMSKQQALIKQAHGELIGLIVGIDAYKKESGFPSLKACSNDAIQLRNTLEDILQLNADKERILVLASKYEAVSKGLIISSLKELAAKSNEEDRLLFYFSGHGHRFKDAPEKFYLVPQDVYDEEDPEAFLDFEKVLDIVKSASAKIKLVFLDACFSGPVLLGAKSHAATFSPKFMQSYLAKTTGIVIMTSSSDSQQSFTQSPDLNLSLFTYYLIRGLRGEKAALDNELWLTTDSLYDFLSVEVQRTAKEYQKVQCPAMAQPVKTGTIHLGNFGQIIVPNSSLELNEYPVKKLIFNECLTSYVNIADILTYIKNFGYSIEYIENLANEKLDEYLAEELGEKVADLIEAIGSTEDDVYVSDAGIKFPGGKYLCKYEADTKKKGSVYHKLIIEAQWFQQGNKIPLIVSTLGMRPTSFSIIFNHDFEPKQLTPGLKARGWVTRSILPEKVLLAHDELKLGLQVEPCKMTFTGFTPKELFGGGDGSPKVALAASVLSLIK